MKVLSVRQPWAWAIIYGGKDIENRNWQTSYRGPLAIHAGKGFDFTMEEMRIGLRGDYGEPITTMLKQFKGNDIRGAIIGVVDLVDCQPSWACDSPWKAGDDPDYFCWRLENPRPLAAPVPCKGQLGLFPAPFRLDIAKGER